MLRTLQTAKQAMHLDQARIDTLANNLANVATTGFRQVLNRVTEVGSDGADGPGADGLPQLETTRKPGPDGSWPVARDLQMGQALDVRGGALRDTGRDTHAALSGRGFFVIRDQEGGEFFTRDGAFRLDDTGQLVSASGMAVQGTGGPINAAGGQISIEEDGTVTVDGAVRGRLRVVDFASPEKLQHRGDSLLLATEDMAPTDVPKNEVAMHQGYLEGSNVDPVQTLVDMIAAQRAFEIESKVLQANDEMLGKSVNTLGRNT
jgi:flagellar basal-body rod protein FlgG